MDAQRETFSNGLGAMTLPLQPLGVALSCSPDDFRDAAGTARLRPFGDSADVHDAGPTPEQDASSNNFQTASSVSGSGGCCSISEWCSLLEATLHALPDAVTIRDASGRVLFENQLAMTPAVRAPDSAFITTLDTELPVRIPGPAARHAPVGADTGTMYPSAFINVKASVCATNPVVRRLLDSLPQMTCQMSAASMTTNWLNKRWYEYTGMRPDGQERHRDYLHPDDRGRGAAAIASAMETRRPFVFEVRVRGTDGNYRWQTANGEPVCNDNGEVALWVATATDTSAQKQLQQDLETETALLHTALDQLPVSVVVTSARGIMQFANKEAREGARHAPV